MQDLVAIVWLYRGQRDRFLALVKDCFSRLCAGVRRRARQSSRCSIPPFNPSTPISIPSPRP